MEWTTRTIYTFKCVQVDPEKLHAPKMSKFYSICNNCVMQTHVGGGIA